MKKNTLQWFLTMCCLFSVILVKAQQKKNFKNVDTSTISITSTNKNAEGVVKCLTSEMTESKIAQGKSLSKEAFEEWLAPKMEEVKEMRRSGRMGIISIPVVVHVIHNGDVVGSGENIPDGQVLSQIEVFNNDFRKLTGTPGDGGGVDTMIEFCMAVVDPNGNPTNGIDRVNLGVAAFDGAAVEGTMKPATIWDPTKYLNMWTARFTGDLASVLGYAQFPSGSGLPGMEGEDCVAGEASTDGVIAAYTTFGSRTIFPGGNYGGTTYDKGRTMTHEVGHMLGLRHLWGDGDCTADDFCTDTPNCDGQYYGSGPAPTECGNVRQIENYMDYSDDIAMDTFTQEQADRMMAVLLNSPRRDDLLQSTVCSPLQPVVQFKPLDCTNRIAYSVNEGTDCGYTEFTIPLSIETGASADAVVTFAIDASSTATISDVEFVTPTVTFPSGSTTDQDLVIRVLNDGVQEGTEDLVVTFTVSGGGATVNPNGNLTPIKIIDNDYANGATRTTVFSDDFEAYRPFSIKEADLGGWTMNDVDSNFTYGDETIGFSNSAYVGTFIVFNPNETAPVAAANWNPHGGNQGLYCFAATSANSPTGTDTALNDDYLFTPQISLKGSNSELRFWARTLTDQWGEERFNVMVSTTNTNIGSFTTIQPSSHPAATPQSVPEAWTEYVYDLSAYDNQDVYIAIHEVSADSYVFMMDDFSVTTELGVQVVVDTANGNDIVLNGPGTIYTKDGVNGLAILDIQNNDSYNYGCVTTEVNRAGVSAQAYNSGLATDKVFRIGAANTTNSGNTTISFYFTEAELLGWETAASESRANLYVNRDVASTTVETVATTITAFGAAGHKVTATFTGIDGDFFFASQAVLGIAENQFNSFNIYPNPSNGIFNLSVSTTDDAKVKLYDIRGRNVYSELHTNNSDVFNTTLDFSSLASGVYMLDVESGSKRAVKKIVIQ